MAPGSKRDRRSRRRGAGRTSVAPYVVAVAVAAVVVGVVISLAVLTSRDGGGDADGPVVLPSPRPADLVQQGHVLGNADAPVTVIEYADFQ